MQVFICMFTLGVCPSGWLKAGSKCYWFSTDAEPWLTATRVCRHKGGQLAIIDSADLLDDVNALRREQGMTSLSSC